MNFTRLILAITLSYLLLMLFTTNVNARERLEDVTIQIMDINDDIDDFINRIELPKPAREKITASKGKAEQHVRPHVLEDPADDLRDHDHPREDLIAEEHSHDEAPAHEHTHEVTAAEVGTSPAEDMDKMKAMQQEAKPEKHMANEREAMGESMKESREHAASTREDISEEADEVREKAREHTTSRDDD
ncbi:MAG TPA: hypothetical protein ENJ84_03810 [Gammaproteobacteria bacterium]|nr:hypothetical protein [Gammaproteobacteria bacterium]